MKRQVFFCLHSLWGNFKQTMKKINPTALFAILLGISTLIICCTLTKGHDWGDDFSAYIMQAKSITEFSPGCYIEKNRFTSENSSEIFGPTAYPWGFPVLLAPFLAGCGLNMLGLKLLGVISFLIFLIFLWVGFRKYHTLLGLLCLVCLFSLNPNMLSFTNQILSDLPFLLFATTSILLMGMLIIEKRTLISPVWGHILLGVIIASAYLIRTQGVMLLITLAITQFIAQLQRLRQGDSQCRQCTTSFGMLLPTRGIFSKSLLLNLIPYASFFCIVLPWEAIMPRIESSTISGLSSFSKYVIWNLNFYFELPADFLSGVPHNRLLYFGSIPIAIAGVMRRYRFDFHIITFIILTFALYISIPFTQDLRYLFPILPFYCSFVISGLELFQGGRTGAEQKFRTAVCFLPVLIILTYFAISSTNEAYVNMMHNREPFSGPYTAESQSMFSFIRSSTEKESTIIFFKPRLMRMMTDRKSLMLRKKEELSRGDYVCLSKERAHEVNQVSLDTMEDLLKREAASLIYENVKFKVYKLTYLKAPLMNR